jgi:serine/threonine protein kinase
VTPCGLNEPATINEEVEEENALTMRGDFTFQQQSDSESEEEGEKSPRQLKFAAQLRLTDDSDELEDVKPFDDGTEIAEPQQDDTKYAVKIIRTQEEELIEVAYEEYKLLYEIRHEGIVRMRDAFYNQVRSTVFLVMDLAPGKAMRQMYEDPVKPERMTVGEIRSAFRQLLEVIDYL